MGNQNFPDDTFYLLDNLQVLRGMNPETVDLVATDPPFNTGGRRAATAGAYQDRWHWADTSQPPDQWPDTAVDPSLLDEVIAANPALHQVIHATSLCQGQDTAAYLCFLGARLLEIHRILKPTGSLYLHCDQSANAGIRLALDSIFGPANFRNELVWRRAIAHNDTRRYGNITDTIYLYARSANATWNGEAITTLKTPQQIREAYPSWDHQGMYRADNITAPLHGRTADTPQHQALAPVRRPQNGPVLVRPQGQRLRPLHPGQLHPGVHRH